MNPTILGVIGPGFLIRFLYYTTQCVKVLWLASLHLVYIYGASCEIEAMTSTEAHISGAAISQTCQEGTASDDPVKP